ncbi:hypothetical protein NE237_005663 [Protea cynaroides]|uniref:Stress-response A/B barrel domain-containing protein n=1 Tax=Protea cynaroides TaxID=273540 RepID=A0A9Q0KLL5_9MAGN|nr:hypothetical protein NE237_005663 [Protea cynaroides]
MEAKGEVIHIFLMDYKDGESPTFDAVVEDFGNLAQVTTTMKDMIWGINVSEENKDEGYTHIFECNFGTEQEVIDYLASDAHQSMSSHMDIMDKVYGFDYVPIVVKSNVHKP